MPNCQCLIIERSDMTVGRKKNLFILKIKKKKKELNVKLNPNILLLLSLEFKNMYQDDIDKKAFTGTEKVKYYIGIKMPKTIVIISSKTTYFSIKFQDIVEKIIKYYL